MLSGTEGSKGLLGAGKGEHGGNPVIGGAAFLTTLPTDKADHGKIQQRLQRETDGWVETGMEKGNSENSGEESGMGERLGDDADHSTVRIRGGNPETSKCWFGRNIIVVEGQPGSP